MVLSWRHSQHPIHEQGERATQGHFRQCHGKRFCVHKDDGKTLRFQEVSRRLYYFDTVNRDEEGAMLITTVDNNKSKLSALDLTQAKRV